MKAGRKPKHAFNTLNVGESVALKGKAKEFAHQFIYQYNKTHKEKLIVINDGKTILAERIS